MFFVLVILYILLQGSDAVLRLNDSQHDVMPPLFYLDSYDVCQRDENALYCSAEFALVSDRPNSLLDMMKIYSESHIFHFNRTKLHYGICVTQNCKKFYEKANGDLRTALEACLNETLSDKYDLKVKILDKYHCKSPRNSNLNIDYLDVIVAAICVLILAVNVVASISEVFLAKRVDINIKQNKAVKLLFCFSLQRNWKKLVSTSASDNSRIQQLQSLHGIRAISMCLVIIAHSFLPCALFIENLEFLTQLYSLKPVYIFLNGTLIMQTFLMTSSFLLVYLWLMHSEKHKDSWYLLPKQILLRWLRLTPVYALSLALTATWFPRIATGPAWHNYIAVEMIDCRLYWWQHILYINNYFHDSKCMLQCWYMATDMHLYILAAVIYLACRTNHSRKIVLISLFLIGMALPAAHVYFQDLDGTQLLTPESALSQFTLQPYFHYVYKRSHTNISGSIVGISMGYLVYYWQRNGFCIKKYQTVFHRFVFWSLFPLAVLCCYSGYILYDTPKPYIYIRAAFAAFLKPTFSLCIGGLIIGFIFKIEDLYRGILEWPLWTILSRLSYSAYLLHFFVIKSYTVSITETFQIGYMTLVTISSSLLVVSFVAAVFLWLLVEAPLNNVVKECLPKPESVEEKKTK